jgi:hypothetical protein
VESAIAEALSAFDLPTTLIEAGLDEGKLESLQRRLGAPA